MFQDTTPFLLALVITFTILVCVAIYNSINSPPPIKQAEKPEPGPSRTREILARFSEFYTNLDPEEESIYDTAILPDPKQHIIHALYVGFDESETEEDREAIKRGLKAITYFQDLVGENPLTKDFNSNDSGSLPTQLLFQDPNDENINLSEEEKKYNEFKNKVIKELNDHYDHLKIENDSSKEGQGQDQELKEKI